jgi:hypothetical protein
VSDGSQTAFTVVTDIYRIAVAIANTAQPGHVAVTQEMVSPLSLGELDAVFIAELIQFQSHNPAACAVGDNRYLLGGEQEAGGAVFIVEEPDNFFLTLIVTSKEQVRAGTMSPARPHPATLLHGAGAVETSPGKGEDTRQGEIRQCQQFFAGEHRHWLAINPCITDSLGGFAIAGDRTGIGVGFRFDNPNFVGRLLIGELQRSLVLKPAQLILPHRKQRLRIKLGDHRGFG